MYACVPSLDFFFIANKCLEWKQNLEIYEFIFNGYQLSLQMELYVFIKWISIIVQLMIYNGDSFWILVESVWMLQEMFNKYQKNKSHGVHKLEKTPAFCLISIINCLKKIQVKKSLFKKLTDSFHQKNLLRQITQKSEKFSCRGSKSLNCYYISKNLYGHASFNKFQNSANTIFWIIDNILKYCS